jgi:hypothetical protein
VGVCGEKARGCGVCGTCAGVAARRGEGRRGHGRQGPHGTGTPFLTVTRHARGTHARYTHGTYTGQHARAYVHNHTRARVRASGLFGLTARLCRGAHTSHGSNMSGGGDGDDAHSTPR